MSETYMRINSHVELSIESSDGEVTIGIDPDIGDMYSSYVYANLNKDQLKEFAEHINNALKEKGE